MLKNTGQKSADPIWTLPKRADRIVARLAKHLNLHPSLARILVSRNISDLHTCRAFLDPASQPLFDPMLLREMSAAVERIARAIRRGERILAYGDYDVDGTCSLAILKSGLEILGGSVDLYVPHRLLEGYGLRREVVADAARNGIRLIVTADTGIRSQDVVEYAVSLGVDVIVTDHHAPDEVLPAAAAVVNPNRRDCPYPNKHLCGAGVIYKLIEALFRQSALPAARQEQLLLSLLKPLTIATIADVVPLLGENRTIAARGLLELQQIRNPGLAALFAIAGLKPGQVPSSHEIAYRIAPRINAAGRIDSATAVTELLLTRDDSRAKTLAAELDRCNHNRRKLQQSMTEQILDSLPGEADAAGRVFFIPGGHLGVVGIVASKLVEHLGGPVVVLTDDPKQSGVLAGSGRSVPRFHLLEALESMGTLFRSFGGHSQAAGLRIESARLDEFRAQFDRCARQRLGEKGHAAGRSVDAEVSFSGLTPGFFRDFQKLEPFGAGNPVPVLLARNVRLAGAIRCLCPGKHFLVPLAQNGACISCKAWDFAHHIPMFQSGTPVDVLLTIEKDSYAAKSGGLPWCVTLRDVRVCVMDS